MVRIKKDKWEQFKFVARDFGFEFFPEIPGIVDERLINLKYNIVIWISSRVVESLNSVVESYNREFELIIALDREGYLDLEDWRDMRTI